MINRSYDQHMPKFGVQSPVIAWQDPWAGDISDQYMRTGTGSVYPSQDPTPTTQEFVDVLQDLGVTFYVHHLFPEVDAHSKMIQDLVDNEIEFCLGNEYGNINGPFVDGTNRYDIPDETVIQAAKSGKLIGLLYDEPEHLQINAGQYRKDSFSPHWGKVTGLTLQESHQKVVESVTRREQHVHDLLVKNGLDAKKIPLISEQVFPTMFHTHARGGMAVCAKTMKESFQSLQLSTALGAAKQYGRDLWICTDLWGPDVGEWFTRTAGLPGHSPTEYASALRMGYLMGATHLFTENIDGLLRYDKNKFIRTEFGEVWDEFIRKYVPDNPLTWNHHQVDPDIVFIHSDDSNYGQNSNLFGNQDLIGDKKSQSIFKVWHLLSHGTIPAHGSCMHISGYDFPRHRLKAEIPREQFPLEKGRSWGESRKEHPLFFPVNNVVVYDEFVQEKQLGQPNLLIAAGSRISKPTITALRKKAEEGATVIVADWLVPQSWTDSGRVGMGTWVVTDDFLSDQVKEIATPFLGTEDCWIQRFQNREVRIYKTDHAGFELDFEIKKTNTST